MANNEMKTYWSHDIAKILDISTSTLRKWSISLEKNGYTFIRDKHDRRAYLERDILSLQKIKELLDTSMNLNNSASKVALMFSEQNSDSRTLIVREESQRSLERYSELITQELQELRNENKELKDYIDQQLQEQNDNISRVFAEQLKMREMLERKKWWKFW